MKTYKLVAAGFLAVSVLMPSLALAASPGDLLITHWNNAADATTTDTITPLDYSDGFGSIPYFRGNGDGGGTYHFLDLGSGIGLSAGNLFVTPNSIETADGHLIDTLNHLQTEISALGVITPQIQSDYATTSTSSKAFIKNKPTLSTVATTGAYSDLTGTPSFATVATSGAYADLTGKPTIGTAYEGTTTRTAAFPIFKSATVSTGTAVVNLTNDGTSGGTSLCTGGVIQDSVNVTFSDAASSYQQSWAFTNSNKTLTITANKFTSANILSGLLGQAAANGSVAKVSVWCYA